MTNKQKAGMLSGITSCVLSFILTFMILRHIQATDVMWLMYWIFMPLNGIAISLIKYIYEVT